MLSANADMRWDIEHARMLLGYVPRDEAIGVPGDQFGKDDRRTCIRSCLPATAADQLSRHFTLCRGLGMAEFDYRLSGG